MYAMYSILSLPSSHHSVSEFEEVTAKLSQWRNELAAFTLRILQFWWRRFVSLSSFHSCHRQLKSGQILRFIFGSLLLNLYFLYGGLSFSSLISSLGVRTVTLFFLILFFLRAWLFYDINRLFICIRSHVFNL